MSGTLSERVETSPEDGMTHDPVVCVYNTGGQVAKAKRSRNTVSRSSNIQRSFQFTLVPFEHLKHIALSHTLHIPYLERPQTSMMTLSKLQLAALTISLCLTAPAQAVLIRSTGSPDNVSSLYTKRSPSSHLRLSVSLISPHRTTSNPPVPSPLRSSL